MAYGYDCKAENNKEIVENFPNHWDEIPISDAQPGDILIRRTGSHAEMALTKGATEHANSGSTSKDGPLKVYEASAATNANYRAFRIKNVEATPSGTLPNVFDEEEEDEEDYEDDTGFYYYGIPKSGEYAGSSSISLAKALKWLVNLISQIAEYLLGILTMAVRIQLIGWTTIFENLITDTVNNITQEEITGDAGTEEGENAEGQNDLETVKSDTSQKNYYTPSSTELMPEGKNKLTVEKIIYNDVPLLDVNIFNMTEAGGKTIKPDGTLGVIRTNIAKWYYIFRKFAIVGLLLVLIYMGIRMAISTVASDKAKYKSMLASWVTSFAIVFCIHYFILAVFEVNDFLVEHIQNNDEGVEIQVYEIARTKAYELKATSGIIGTIMYMTLVVLMVKFFYIYLKRYLTVNILVMIAPIIGISYSIDKIKDNKSQSFTHWMQDFSFMVLLQSVHALIYAYFATQALKLSGESIGGIFFACIVLNFMTKADKIMTTVFGMEKSAAVNNIMTPQSITEAFAGLAFAKGAIGATGKALGFGMHVGKEALGFVGDVGGVVLPSRLRYGFNGLYNRATDKLFGDANFTTRRRTSDTKNVSKIDKKLAAQRNKEKALRRKMRKAAITSGKKTITGVAKGMVGTAMLVTNPGAAVGLLTSARKDLKLSRDKYKDTKWYSEKRSIPNHIRKKRKAEKRSIIYKMGSSSTKRIYDRTKQQYSSAKKDKEKIMTKMPAMSVLLKDATDRETELIETFNDRRDEYIRNATEGLSGEELAKAAVLAREQFEKEYINTVNDVFLVTDVARSVARKKERSKLKIEESDEVIDKTLSIIAAGQYKDLVEQKIEHKVGEAKKQLEIEIKEAEADGDHDKVNELKQKYDNFDEESIRNQFESEKLSTRKKLEEVRYQDIVEQKVEETKKYLEEKIEKAEKEGNNEKITELKEQYDKLNESITRDTSNPEKDDVIDKLAEVKYNNMVEEKIEETKKQLEMDIEKAEKESDYEKVAELQKEYQEFNEDKVKEQFDSKKDEFKAEIKKDLKEELKNETKDDVTNLVNRIKQNVKGQLISDKEVKEGIEAAINLSATLELTNEEKDTIVKELKPDLLSAGAKEEIIEKKLEEVAKKEGISMNPVEIKRLSAEMTRVTNAKKARKVEQDDITTLIETELEKESLVNPPSETVGGEITDMLKDVKVANREYNAAFKKNDKDSSSYVSKMYDNVSRSMRDVVDNQPFDVYKEILKKYKKK